MNQNNRPSGSRWANRTNIVDNLDSQDTSALVNNDLLENQAFQDRALLDFDQGIERLTQAAMRQKRMAIDLENEVDLHNEILDDIDTEVGRTDAHLRKNTRNINAIQRQSGTCLYWLIVLLLAGVILTLACI